MRHALLLTAMLALCAPAVLAQERIVSGDAAALPEAVRATRDAMLAAAKGADLAGLQAIIDAQGKPIQLGFGGAETAAEFATGNSQTADGLDVLADLVDILEAPYAKVADSEGGSFFIWPYLAGVEDLSALTDADKVVAYQLITPDALVDFADYGGWLGFRTIIDDDGTWQAWVAGD